MRDRRGKEWFPLWVDKWLFGSTRIEFTPEERGVWIDLLALAAKDDGFIRANVGVPYPLEQLAGLFIVSSELLSRVIEKSISTGKIERLPDDTLIIKSWPKYSLSDRWRREVSADKSQLDLKTDKTEVTSDKTEVASVKREAIYIDINRNIDINKDIVSTDDLNPQKVILIFNEITGQRRSLTTETQRLISKLIKKGYTETDFRSVIEFKTAEFSQKDEMKKYIRPATFFAEARFEDYLEQVRQWEARHSKPGKKRWSRDEREGWRRSFEKNLRQTLTDEDEIKERLAAWDKDHPEK